MAVPAWPGAEAQKRREEPATPSAPERRAVPAAASGSPKTDTKRAQNRGPKATRAKNGETLISDDSTKDLLDF